MGEERLLEGVREGDIGAVLGLWGAGGRISRRVVQTLSQDSALHWVELLSAVEPQGPRLAAAVLAESPADPQLIDSRLRVLSTHRDRRVRECAHRALGSQLTRRFSQMLPILAAWVADPEPLVRLAAAQATALPASTEHIGWGDALLEVLAPLLADRSPQVCRALGPRVLAKIFLQAYPDEAVEYLAHWSTSHDEAVLWNVAMAFSAPAGSGPVGKALIILRRLALDERPRVRAAVIAALRALAARSPSVAIPKLRSWLEDEERASLAKAVLRASS